MSPVEQRPPVCPGVWPQRGHDGLEDGQEDAQQPDHRVGVKAEAGQGERVELGLDHDEDDGGDGEEDGQGHQGPVEDEPEVLAHELLALPCPLEIPARNIQTCCHIHPVYFYFLTWQGSSRLPHSPARPPASARRVAGKGGRHDPGPPWRHEQEPGACQWIPAVVKSQMKGFCHGKL